MYCTVRSHTCTVKNELDGTGGTKKYGRGEVALAMNKILSNANIEYTFQMQKLKEMETGSEGEERLVEDLFFMNHGKNLIITRINVIHEYVFSNPSAKTF